MQLLHCDNIQFDTVALLLLTLTHPKRITAIQLRSVSALSSLAEIRQIQCIPYRRTGCHRKVLLLQSWLFNLYCLVEGAGGDIHCGFTPCISDRQKNKSFQPIVWKNENQLKTLAKMYVMCYTDSTMKALIH